MVKQGMTRLDVERAGKKGATGSPIAKILDHFYLIVNPEEQSLGRWLSNEGMWEAWITSCFTNIIKPGDVVCDIGANYGYFTRLFESIVGPNGYVYAVEANPMLSELLRESIAKYPILDGSPVEVLNIAAIEKKRTVTLNISSFLGGASIVGIPEDSHPVEIQGFALDEVIYKKVDVFKIDIEGAEPLAMAGMKRLLKSSRCCVVEVGNYHPKEFLESLFMEYEVTKINFLGKEENYSLSNLRNEKDFVMIVLRKKTHKSFTKKIAKWIKYLRVKTVSKVTILLIKVVRKILAG